MKVIYSLVAVLLLMLLAYAGASVEGLKFVFLSILPYIALIVFLIGLTVRIISWAKSPVPFRIPTTCGQQRTLPWFKESKIESPTTTAGVIGRMLLEILFFRSLFRNTKSEINPKGPNYLTFASNYWLWFFGLVFHWSFLVVVLRHLRFFTEPVPGFIVALQELDGFFQIGVPIWYITSLGLVGAVTFLFLRRLLNAQLNYISLANDYFPLFLILGIGLTGVLMRHFYKTDITGIKEIALGLVSFNPISPAQSVGSLFYIHFFLVLCLFAYFPFSKLTHMAGVFLSPTRNLANNNRAKRHINPWNPTVKFRTYEEYEDEFREKMKGVGIPVEKE